MKTAANLTGAPERPQPSERAREGFATHLPTVFCYRSGLLKK